MRCKPHASYPHEISLMMPGPVEAPALQASSADNQHQGGQHHGYQDATRRESSGGTGRDHSDSAHERTVTEAVPPRG